MKDFRGMKRQRSRNRKPSGNQSNPNRAYESNGPEGTKVRGNAQTIYEKYQQLARDANSSGDRVLAENHLQHAEHYFRMIRQMQPTRPVSEFVQRDPFSNGFDDYDDEVEGDNAEQDENAVVGAEDAQPSFDEPRYENRDRGNDRDGNRNNRDNNRGNDRDRDGNRNNRDRDNNRDRNNNRDNRDRNEPRPPRDNLPRDNAPRDHAPRDNAPRERDRERDEPQFDENGNRRETRRERYERRRQQRFSEQEQNVNAPASANGPVNGNGSEEAYIAPAFIASTEPLGASRPKETISNDAAALPAFLHKPVSRPVVEDAPEAAEAPAKPKRAPRKRKEDAAAAEEA